MAGDNCDDAVEELYGYLDGELTAEKRAYIRGHLDDCGPCLDAFDFEADLRKLLADRCRDTVPDGLRARIAAALHADSTD
jgi:mycothiol system anti-sigma-R factor